MSLLSLTISVSSASGIISRERLWETVRPPVHALLARIGGGTKTTTRAWVSKQPFSYMVGTWGSCESHHTGRRSPAFVIPTEQRSTVPKPIAFRSGLRSMQI